MPGTDFLNPHDDYTRFVYHYTSRAIAIEKILFRRTLRFGPFSSVNDPWESKSWSITIKSCGSRPTDQMEDEIRKWMNLTAKERTKVLCMSTDRAPDDKRPRNGNPPRDPKQSDFHRGYARSRMWAQYADCHRGMCLVFDRVKLTQQIKATVNAVDCFSADVMYTNYLLFNDSLTIDYNAVEANGKEKALGEHLRDSWHGLFFLKSEDWKDEAEYRWILFDNDDAPRFIPFGDSLVAAIVGVDFHNAYGPALNELLDSATPVLKMSWPYGNPLITPM